MQPLVGNSTVASAVFAVVFGVWIMSEMVLTGRKRPRGHLRGQDRGSGVFVFGSMFVAFFIMDVGTSVSGMAMSGNPWVIFVAGILVALAGIGLRLWAIRVLGRFFTSVIAVSPDQQVVDHGPYRLIRHPSYTGALITVLGAALCLANWLSLAAIVPVFLAYSYRIRVEESSLEGQLGHAYSDYRQRTKRLVPFIY